jgi:E3 ubiquitin-protein ligase HERC2
LAVTDAGQVFAWGDNDHGQQGNGSITVNRRPTLVQGIDGIKITRVACGSSHSVAWTAPEPPSVAPPEPVPFPTIKDPLGSTAAGKFKLKIHLNRFHINCCYIFGLIVCRID